MNVEIIRVSQDIDLRTGESSYAVVLSIPGGRIIRAIVVEDDARVLLSGVAENRPEQINEVPAPAVFTPPTIAIPDDVIPVSLEQPTANSSVSFPDGAIIYGGGTVEAAPAPAQRKPAKRPNRIPKDEMGYPIIRNTSTIDADSLMASGVIDDDGISQG